MGERFEVEVGPVAHGGHFVARLPEPDTRVVFVRHALPGERVVVEITDGTEGDKFWRADAVSVLIASEDRVEAPCRFAGPDACGGCDFQHVALDRQRRLKADVISEQLRRLAGLEVEVVVEEVPGDDHGLRWRTRQSYVALPDGLIGMRKHRSHDVVAVDECLLESHSPPSYDVRGQHFDAADNGFWQVHPGAPEALVEAVLEMLDPQPGERALDLYAGVGLFARFLAERVGDSGHVLAIEADRVAAGHAGTNLAAHASADVAAGSVEAVLRVGSEERFDLVVLDPPRTGAKRAVVEQIVACSPRAVAYVACDPGALARDIAIFAEHGFRLEALRAFDLFPMTHHVECVAKLSRSADG